MFILQKKNERGWRRFIVSEISLARFGGTTNVVRRAMTFEDEKAADFFRTIHSLTSFDVVESDETDDQDAEHQEWWREQSERKEREKMMKKLDRKWRDK